MTIRELYEWAVENNVDGFEIRVLQRDGCYSNYVEPYINVDVGEVEL